MNEGEKGFSLIETLCAFAVLSVTLGALYAAIATELASSARADARLRAFLVAQSQLNRVGGDIPMAPGAHSGRDGDIEWRISIAPESQRAAFGFSIYRIVAEVAGPNGFTAEYQKYSLDRAP